VATQAPTDTSRAGSSAGGRIAREVSSLQASLLEKLRAEIHGDADQFAEAAQRLAREFGSVAAAAVDATTTPLPAPPEELVSLYQPGHMRRRLEQLLETHRRYGHPFAMVVFDASGPGTRDGSDGGGQETVLAIVAAALRESIRIVDEAFRLEEDAICVLAPNLSTVEGVQMAERLLGLLDDLEEAGGLRITIAAGVVSCPDHGGDAEGLLQKADAAMWRARALGQPVGVGQLRAMQDR
jgi:diguanylate cyclase (GGDEF)-like protein